MAINDSRSMNQDLRKGASEGAFKNLTPDRGGEVEEGFAIKRNMVLQTQYGLAPETPMAEVKEPTLSL